MTDDIRFCCFIKNGYYNHSHSSACHDLDLILSCSDLIPTRILKGLTWTLAVLILLLNISTLLYHASHAHSESVILLNLSISDEFCGLYLLMIVSADIYYNEEFVLFSTRWHHSVACKLAAVISAMSLISSATCANVLALKRCITISSFTKNEHLDSGVNLSLSAMWIAVILFAFVPLLGEIIHGDRTTALQGEFCLFFTRARHQAKLTQYLAFSINVYLLSSVIFILICYLKIHNTATASRHSVQQFSSVKKGGHKILLFTLMTVVSNLACWLPLCGISIYLITGHSLSPGVVAHIVTMTMPINSLYNPCFYTFVTKKFKEAIKLKLGVLQSR